MNRFGMGAWCVAGLVAVLAGCSERPGIFPNQDPVLRKTKMQFAADAAVRHPFKADAPRGGAANARSHVNYTLSYMEIVNLSDEDWKDVEVWVNREYVCYIPVMQSKLLKTINFEMLYDAKGQYFPTDRRVVLIKQVELYRDGKMYDVVNGLAE